MVQQLVEDDEIISIHIQGDAQNVKMVNWKDENLLVEVGMRNLEDPKQKREKVQMLLSWFTFIITN